MEGYVSRACEAVLVCDRMIARGGAGSGESGATGTYREGQTGAEDAEHTFSCLGYGVLGCWAAVERIEQP